MRMRAEVQPTEVAPSQLLLAWRDPSSFSNWLPMLSSAALLRDAAAPASPHRPLDATLHIELALAFGFVDLGFIDLVLRSFACELPAADGARGGVLLCLRPLRQSDLDDEAVADGRVQAMRMPPHPRTAHPDKAVTARLQASIDVLCEPVSSTSARYVVQLTLPTKPSTPRWLVTNLLQRCVSDIATRLPNHVRHAATMPKLVAATEAEAEAEAAAARWAEARLDN